MKLIPSHFFAIAFIAFTLSSCESEPTKIQASTHGESQRIETQKNQDDKILFQQEYIQSESQSKEEREEKEIYDKYINNSLSTGSTPYSQYYGRNTKCNDYGCSQIKVITPVNSDVLVTIKKNENVVRHAFIQAGDSFTFSFRNGTYQAFFYYGKGWNPEKEMKGGEIKGGFITNEDFGKDNPQSLNNSILTYELILQENGNFSTRPSNPEEAL